MAQRLVGVDFGGKPRGADGSRDAASAGDRSIRRLTPQRIGKERVLPQGLDQLRRSVVGIAGVQDPTELLDGRHEGAVEHLT
eukprot:12553304-Alexandrium_andersonii.AAC.1